MIRRAILLLPLLVFVACREQHGGRMLVLADTDPLEWSRTLLTLPVDDTLAQRDLGIYIRFDRTLEVRELELTISTQAPDWSWTEDVLTVGLTPSSKVDGDFFEAVIPYRTGVVFPRRGTYIFNITTSPVRGIRAIGIIENGQGQAKTF